MKNKSLADIYIEHEKAYWLEIVTQLRGPLKSIKPQLPPFYTLGARQLVIQGNNGIVSARFSNDVVFNEKKFNEFLYQVEAGHGPNFWEYTSEALSKMTIESLVQIFTGNGIKILNKGKIPQDIEYIAGFPRFPPPWLIDPESKTKKPICIMRIDIGKASIESFALNLRDLCMTEVNSGKEYRPFLWEQLDIYGSKTVANLQPETGKLNANRELISVLASLNLGESPKRIVQNPFGTHINKLQSVIRDFKILLEKDTTTEEELQRYLLKYPALIIPDYIACVPKAKLGKEYITDFILERPSSAQNRCLLVEIEPANTKLFTKAEYPSSELNHAINQVRQWRLWLRTNGRYANESLGLSGLHCESDALVIIGRANSMSKSMKKKFDALGDSERNTDIITYDELVVRSERILQNLCEMEKIYGVADQ